LGIKFFYWTQSFGRITGSSSWSNNTGPFYLLNVFFYAFLPWTILFIMAFYRRTKDIIRNKKISLNDELISYAGFLIPLIMLSLSSYKLPHYIYCTVPFAAILIAREIERWLNHDKLYLILSFTQLTLGLILVVTVSIISFYVFPQDDYFFLIPMVLFIAIMGYVFISSQDRIFRFFIPSVVAALIANYNLNLFFMTPLLTYQASSQAGAYLKKSFNEADIYLYNENKRAKSRSFNYYLDKDVNYIEGDINDLKLTKNRSALIYTGDKGYNNIINQNIGVELIAVFDSFRVSKLNWKFLNKKTRSFVVKNKYLLMLTKE